MGAVLVGILLVIVAIVVGVWVIGLAFKLLWLAIVGLVIGALARLVVPGGQSIGILRTTLYGVAGSLLGGIVGDALDVGALLSLVFAVAVAAVLVGALESGRGRDD